jgi:hypothetical protein
LFDVYGLEIKIMSLLNYTTKKDADETADEIAKLLCRAGARAVLTEFDEKHGYVTSLSFKMKINDQDVAFRLPCDWKPVLIILENDSHARRRGMANESQAVRVAWRIVKDWVEAQLAIIEMKMVKTEQVFLPYVIMRDNKTLYEHVESNPKFLLGRGRSRKCRRPGALA